VTVTSARQLLVSLPELLQPTSHETSEPVAEPRHQSTKAATVNSFKNRYDAVKREAP